jgi:hypothetical protein
VTREEVISVTGPIEDRFVLEILELGADHAELIEAASQARGDDAGGPMSAKVARLCGILEAVDMATSDPLELDERL